MPDNEIRDQLAEIMRTSGPGTYGDAADAVVAAGWRPPARVITEAADLDALPLGSVCRTDILGGDVWWRVSDEGWETPLSARAWSSAEIVGRGDVTVLWTPEEVSA